MTEEPAPDSQARVHKAFADPTYDLVLLSSDGVAFQVHRAVLASAMQSFDFGAPVASGDAGTDPEAQTATVKESARDLELVLAYCYPSKIPGYSDEICTLPVRRWLNLAAIAQKYNAYTLALESRIRIMHFVESAEAHLTSANLPSVEDTLRVFDYAYRHNLRDEARRAANLLCNFDPRTSGTLAVAVSTELDPEAYEKLRWYLAQRRLAIITALCSVAEPDCAQDSCVRLVATINRAIKNHILSGKASLMPSWSIPRPHPCGSCGVASARMLLDLASLTVNLPVDVYNCSITEPTRMMQ